MYISKIDINGYRNFRKNEILFNDGINVIIGHNNAGKSNLLQALSLVIDSHANRRLNIFDFYRNVDVPTLKTAPPQIEITVTLEQSTNGEPDDDLVLVSTFLTKLETPYEAKITYSYFLPEDKCEDYKNVMKVVQSDDLEEVWNIINRDFLRFYVYKMWGGDPTLKMSADSEMLNKFDFQFLDAIRDVERDMQTGKNSLLRNVIDFFIDYDIKKDKDKSKEDKAKELHDRNINFRKNAKPLLSELKARMNDGKSEFLDYAKKMGTSINGGLPDFDAQISERELYSALKLIISNETGLSIPATHNGLGYNNLIYMSLLLSKMQIDSDCSYLGSNAKMFSILAIEEPEAHLHPSMQHKFLKFLKEYEKNKVRQIFITTHSTHITSAVSLDDLICLHNSNNCLCIGYPGKVYDSTNLEDEKSKAYVRRFLDATKSNMLFANKIILVEGIAEEILIPIFAKCLGLSLEEQHICIVNIGGRYFEHFLKLFDSSRNGFINKKVACITDRDPVRRKKSDDGELTDEHKHHRFCSCYPYEYDVENDIYDYKTNSDVLLAKNNANINIKYFSQLANSKTLEYDIALSNPQLKLLITSSNGQENLLNEIIASGRFNTAIQLLSDKNKALKRIKDSLNDSDWNDEEKFNALFASIYLYSIENEKGIIALELADALDNNLYQTDAQSFNVPQYIKDALFWICSK